MSISTIFWLLGTIPLFASRIFLPAFLMALFFRFPDYFPFVDVSTPVDQNISAWLLILLGALSVFEIWAEKNSDIQYLFNKVEAFAKPVAFFLVQYQLTDEASSQIIKQIQWAGFEMTHVLAAIGSGIVFWLNGFRRQFYDFLYKIDDDDNLGLRTMFSWLEDSLVIFGFLLFVVLGIVAFIFYGIFWLLLYLFQKKVERNQEKHKRPCLNCQQLVLPFAVACGNCHTHQKQVHTINFLGVRSEKTVLDIEDHRLRLLRHKRCPECASRLPNQAYKQACPTCGITTSVLVAPKKYLRELDKRFLITLLVATALGFVPVVGIVAATIFADFYLISPLRRYVPTSQVFLAKVLIRLFFILIIFSGAILGFLAAPLYCLVRYFGLRSFFLKNN